MIFNKNKACPMVNKCFIILWMTLVD